MSTIENTATRPVHSRAFNAGTSRSGRSNSLVRRLLGAILALLVVVGVGVGTASSASANSTTCAWYGMGIKYGVRNGSFCGTINGSGTYIWSISGNFGTTIPGPDMMCNPSMKMDVYDRYGRWITWRQGPQKGGCYVGTFNWLPSIPVQWDFPQADGGSVRVALQSYGQDKVYLWFGLHR